MLGYLPITDLMSIPIVFFSHGLLTVREDVDFSCLCTPCKCEFGVSELSRKDSFAGMSDNFIIQNQETSCRNARYIICPTIYT